MATFVSTLNGLGAVNVRKMRESAEAAVAAVEWQLNAANLVRAQRLVAVFSVYANREGLGPVAAKLQRQIDAAVARF